jgi:hypothetical protein
MIEAHLRCMVLALERGAILDDINLCLKHFLVML